MTATAASVALAGCPPNPVPSPSSTTVAFPTGNGGSVTLPAYADLTGSFDVPPNNATAAATIRLESGESDYDNFPAGSQGGTTLVYLEAAVTSATPITYASPMTIVLTTRSASCFSSAHTYYADLDSGGLTLASVNPVSSSNGTAESFTFGSNSFTTGTVQVTINQL